MLSFRHLPQTSPGLIWAMVAKRRRMTVAEWFRHVLRSARQEEPTSDPRRKLEVLHSAVRHSFPSGDIQKILAGIERGYLDDNVQ